MVMYQEHFGLQRPPFSMHPDPDFLYLSEQHSSAKAFLESSALVNDSFVVITGSIGAGKTTLVEGFLAELSPSSTVVARINQTRLSATGFLQLLLDELGLKAFKAKKPQLLARLNDFLKACGRDDKTVVLVVDEAQNLSRAVLEEIRLLTGSHHAACLSVVLIGQPEFLDVLESPNLKQLAQRCRLRSHLIALDLRETREYVAHRLEVAGAQGESIFSEQAVQDVFSHTGGVPRLINNLCDTALICAFADGLESVDEAVIAAALKELKWKTEKPQVVEALAQGRDADEAYGKVVEDNAALSAAVEEKDAEIRELESKLAAAAIESKANLEELETAGSKISRLETTESDADARAEIIVSRQQRLTDLQEQIESFLNSHETGPEREPQPDVDTLVDNLSWLEARLKESDELLNAIETSGSRNEDAMVAGDRKITELTEELAASKSKQESADGELQELADKADALERLESEFAELQARESALQTEKENLGQSVGELQERAEKARLREEELEGELEAKAVAEEQMRAEIKGQKEESEGQARALEDAQLRKQELESKLEAKSAEEEQLRAENKGLKEESEGQARALEDAQRQLTEHEASLAANSETITSLTNSGSEANETLEDTRKKLSASEAQLSELELANEENSGKIVRLDEKISSRDHSIRTLEAEVRRKNKLIDDLHDQLKALPELESKVETLSAENAELRNDVESKMHRVVELEEALSLSQQRLDDARHEIDNSHNEHVGLHKEIAEQKSQVSELQKGTSERDDLVKSLQIECQNRKQDLRRLRVELDESLDQSRELRDSVSVGEDRARELEAELQAALETIREMNESGHQANSEAIAASDALTENQHQIESLKAELQDKEETLLSMASTLKEKTETIKVLELDAETTAQHKQVDGVETESAALNELVKQLKREVVARDRCIDDLETALSSSTESLADMTKQMQAHESRMRQLEEQLESSRMAAAELREEAGRTDREFDETAVLEDENEESNDMSVRLQTLGAGLLVSASGHPARRVPLRRERLIIGRTRDSDIKIDNEFASRHHAQIVYDNGRFFVEDLNSTNGIFVNSRRVKRRRLRNRDIISIGRDRLIFVLEQHTSH